MEIGSFALPMTEKKKSILFSFEEKMETEGDFPFLVEAIADTITVGKKKENTTQNSCLNNCYQSNAGQEIGLGGWGG